VALVPRTSKSRPPVAADALFGDCGKFCVARSSERLEEGGRPAERGRLPGAAVDAEVGLRLLRDVSMSGTAQRRAQCHPVALNSALE
jgi:hypothetical protein